MTPTDDVDDAIGRIREQRLRRVGADVDQLTPVIGRRDAASDLGVILETRRRGLANVTRVGRVAEEWVVGRDGAATEGRGRTLYLHGAPATERIAVVTQVAVLTAGCHDARA